MHAYMHTYIHTHTQIHTYIHTNIHTNKQKYIHACINTSTCIHTINSERVAFRHEACTHKQTQMRTFCTCSALTGLAISLRKIARHVAFVLPFRAKICTLIRAKFSGDMKISCFVVYHILLYAEQYIWPKK